MLVALILTMKILLCVSAGKPVIALISSSLVIVFLRFQFQCCPKVTITFYYADDSPTATRIVSVDEFYQFLVAWVEY
jgi:hypothetical protein